MAGDILIIGGGFAGLEAARVLSRRRSKLGGRRILLVDAKTTFDFLPLLPDVAGNRVHKSHVTLDLVDYLKALGVNFEHGEVVSLDTDAQDVYLKDGNVLSYEFLIVCCGSETNFYGQSEVARHALKLDNVHEAGALAENVAAHPDKKILIVGGGYTGIEVASHLALLLRRRKVKKYSVSIAERGEDILGPLPEWIKDSVRANLCRLRINVYCDCSVSEVSDQKVNLSNGLHFENYLLVWTAGVQTPLFVRDLKFEKDKQGRLVVNKEMVFHTNCFAVGDAVSFQHKGRTLRMAVQFSLAQADVAAKNILLSIAGKKLKSYSPLDLGFVVPMANKKASGKILFLRASGLFGWFLHVMMCAYRSLGLKNRVGVLCDSFFK